MWQPVLRMERSSRLGKLSLWEGWLASVFEASLLEGSCVSSAVNARALDAVPFRGLFAEASVSPVRRGRYGQSYTPKCHAVWRRNWMIFIVSSWFPVCQTEQRRDSVGQPSKLGGLNKYQLYPVPKDHVHAIRVL